MVASKVGWPLQSSRESRWACMHVNICPKSVAAPQLRAAASHDGRMDMYVCMCAHVRCVWRAHCQGSLALWRGSSGGEQCRGPGRGTRDSALAYCYWEDMSEGSDVDVASGCGL